MSYGMVGENKVSLLQIDRTSELGCIRPPYHDGSYVRSQYCTSAMWVFRENFIFSLLSAYSPTPRAIRNTLKFSTLVCNLHVI